MSAVKSVQELQVSSLSDFTSERRETATLSQEISSRGGVLERETERFFSVYVALTYIPGGGLLTGFAMRSDPNVAFG